MVKTSLDQIKFARIEMGNEVHFTADWDDQSAKYTTDLHKEIRKTLKKMAKDEFGYFNGVTGSSVYVLV